MVKKSRFVGALLTTAAGVAAGLLLSEKPGKKIRAGARREYQHYRKILAEEDIEGVAKDIFGRSSAASKKALNSAKDELAAGFARLHKNAKTVDKKKYRSLIDEVVARLKKDKEITPTSLKKLTSYLSQDIKKLSSGSKPAKKAS